MYFVERNKDDLIITQKPLDVNLRWFYDDWAR